MKKASEYLNVVTENDQIIGQGTRENIHQNHSIHRGIHIFITNKKGQILLQQRSFKKNYYPGFYDASVGGQVLTDESYETCALREAQEELGLKIAPQKLKKVYDYKSYSQRQKENRRLFVFSHSGPFKIDPLEVKKVEFSSIEKIKKTLKEEKIKFTQGFKLSFRHYLKFIS